MYLESLDYGCEPVVVAAWKFCSNQPRMARKLASNISVKFLFGVPLGEQQKN